MESLERKLISTSNVPFTSASSVVVVPANLYRVSDSPTTSISGDLANLYLTLEISDACSGVGTSAIGVIDPLVSPLEIGNYNLSPQRKFTQSCNIYLPIDIIIRCKSLKLIRIRNLQIGIVSRKFYGHILYLTFDRGSRSPTCHAGREYYPGLTISIRIQCTEMLTPSTSDSLLKRSVLSSASNWYNGYAVGNIQVLKFLAPRQLATMAPKIGQKGNLGYYAVGVALHVKRMSKFTVKQLK